MPFEDIFLGFDPGGKGGFGAAIISTSESATVTVSSVAEALGWVVSKCGPHKPVAAGIDSLLHWSDGQSGWRSADRLLIRRYPNTIKSVVSPNSLYGAMAIGGMSLALRLRETWPTILLNETHPKVLIPALGGKRYSDKDAAAALLWFGERSGLNVSSVRNGHELDALLSAWATRQGLAEQWHDLVGNDPSLIRPVGPITYLWPD